MTRLLANYVIKLQDYLINLGIFYTDLLYYYLNLTKWDLDLLTHMTLRIKRRNDINIYIYILLIVFRPLKNTIGLT